uniref:TSA: Wollemia nobilis Ref_Wollemi_Transcript_3815_1788 transcribed RNA sequence n=1 Tax=Wollemia nobilis TaxID=56998 RepID=A0A0C9SAE8_9CONI
MATIGAWSSCVLCNKKSTDVCERRKSGNPRIGRSSFFAFPLHLKALKGGLISRNLNRRHGFRVSCSSSSSAYTGRVGTIYWKGNVSLASFGLKPKRFPNGTKMDFSQSLSGMLPIIVAGTAAAALINPATFAWVSQEYYAPALGGIMLSIGVQLSVKDFALAFQRPLPLTIGYVAQYLLKPVLGLLIARAFRTPPIFAAGFILTASVAGAQLSSYASFLSKGDVALSIVLTSFSTISSVIVTPLLTGLLIGSVVPVDGIAMAKSILQVVLLPVSMGLALNTYAKPLVNLIRPFMPLMAMVCTSLCIGSPLAINRSQIMSIEGLQLLLPVLAFHVAAFTIGYWVSKLPCLRQEENVCRTISLCTGMQSSTLAGLLATQFLGGSQAVPAACSVVAMAIMGLSLASFWGKGFRIRDIPAIATRQLA